ncbi:MAG: hypothetical protein A2Z34_09235 [Planctomycetes bacterium RBG_16_59_8]|nr:MAG: hypothetical protein A2Z34_09235 [Planctomycetes bacterium RBG_16_59_8]
MDFNISLSGLRTALDRQSVTANNLANVATPAFKAQRVAQVNVSSGGSRVASVSANLSQGPLELSEGAFHLAVRGNGWFALESPDGPRYTRAGIFHVDGGGNLTESNGNRLSPNIQVPSDASGMEIMPGGEVFAVLSGGDRVQIGRISLARFPNEQGLSQEGANLVASGPASGDPRYGPPGVDPFGDIAFGYLEGSNVDLASEIVDQIVNRVAAMANIGALKAEKEMSQEIIDLVA